MADRYWVGGSGTWSDVNHWSTSQGGGGGASVPTTGDNANIFSVAPSVTIDQDVAIVGLANMSFGSFSGTFKTNNYNISVTNMVEVPTGTVYFGSSVLTARRFTSYALGDCSGMTVNLGAVADTPAVTCTLSLSGAARTLSTLNLLGSGKVEFRAVSPTYTVTSFNVLGTNKLLECQGSLTFSVGTFSATGTAGNPITISSSSPIMTFSKSSGTVNCDYLVLKNCHATGGATWNAGPNSVDNGGNTGWIFGAVPTCSFTVSPVGTPVAAAAGTYTVASVSATNAPCTGGSWTTSLTGAPAWITAISPASGTGSTLTYVTCVLQENTGAQRTGNVLVNGVSVAVSQAAAPLPTCSFHAAGPVMLPAASGVQVPFTITHSPDPCFGNSWLITTNSLEGLAGWASVSNTSGNITTSPVIVFTTTSENTSLSPRYTSLRLETSSGYWETFAVIQEGATPTICETISALDYGPFYKTAAAQASSNSVVIIGPADCAGGITYTVESDSVWLSLNGYVNYPYGDIFYFFMDSPPHALDGSARLGISLTENTDAAARYGNITITPQDVPVGVTANPIILTYVQDGTGAADPCTSWSTLNAGPYTVSYAASTMATQKTIAVVGSPVGCMGLGWNASVDVPWLALTQTLETAFNITWDANEGPARVGHVTLHGNPDQVIEITQEAGPTVVTTCGINLTCPEGGTHNVSSYASTPSTQKHLTLVGDTPDCVFEDLVVTSTAPWLYVAEVDAKHYNVDWSANASGVPRTGEITATYKPAPGHAAPPSVTVVLLVLNQEAEIVSAQPPDPPLSVVATLNSDHTATVTWNNGNQIGLTDTQFQIVLSGSVSNPISIGVVSYYTTPVLLPNVAYNFRVALVNSAGASPAVSSNSVIYTLVIPPDFIKPPLAVVATFDEPTQSILVEWDLNGQIGLFSYLSIGLNGVFSDSQETVPVATSFKITDLSPFVNGNLYTFQIALTRYVNNDKYTSSFTASNTIVISKYTTPRDVYKAQFFNQYFNDYQSVIREPVPVSHLVSRRTASSTPVVPSSYYATDGSALSIAAISYVPVTKSFTDHVFTVTNSYGDKLTASTTWNYENRVGLVFFELPLDTSINNNNLTLYFKIAPEIYNTIYNSNRVTLNYYTLDPAFLALDAAGNIMVKKDAYLIKYAPEQACEPSNLSDLKAAGRNYVKRTISPSTIIRLDDGRRIVAIRVAMSLAELATLPTGFNYVPILVSSMQLTVEETEIPHPVNFRLLPSATDITLQWDKPSFPNVYGYRVDIQKELETGEFGIYRGDIHAPEADPGAWAEIFVLDGISASVTFSLKSQITQSSPLQIWDDSVRYAARVTTLVGGKDREFSIPSYTLKGGVGTFTVPDPPSSVQIFSGNNKFFLSWESPLNNVECPVYKFEVTVFDVDASVPVTPVPISVHKYEGATAYETMGIEINNNNATIINGHRYFASIVCFNAIGISAAAVSENVTVAPTYRKVEVDNLRYKKFYPYPVELRDPSTFGLPLYDKSVVESGVVYVENHIPTLEYDIKNKKCLVDLKPYVPIEERFEITPATRSSKTSSDYPLSFVLHHKDIRAGSVSIKWYVSGVQEVITDTGNGFVISSEKIDNCGNKIPSQQLGFVDYAAGIISCSLPEITSGYAIVNYAANLPIMDDQQYIWSPTPHFGLNLHLREPVYFGATQMAYLLQNADRLRPGYTVLEYVEATIELRSVLSNVTDSVSIELESDILGAPVPIP